MVSLEQTELTSQLSG